MVQDFIDSQHLCSSKLLKMKSSNEERKKISRDVVEILKKDVPEIFLE